MSIIIKDVKIPSGCYDCAFRDKTWDECKCPPNKGYSILSCLEHDKRVSWCSLVELPEKHGRLIDANKLKETLDYYIAEAGWGPGVNEVLGWVKEFIDSEPTIVEHESEDVR